MDAELQYRILIWAVIFNAAAAMGLGGLLKASRKLVHPGLLLFILFFLAYGIPALLVGFWGPLPHGMFKWEYLPAGLVFASLFLVLLWGSFFYSLPLLRRFHQGELAQPKSERDSFIPLPQAIVGISLLALVIFLVTNHYAGGVLFQRGSIWEEGEFHPQIGFYTKLGMLTATALFTPATFLAGLHWGRSRAAILFLSPLLHVFYLTASTSRGAFMPVGFFFAAAYMATTNPRKMTPHLVVSAIIAAVGIVLIANARVEGWSNFFMPFTDFDLFWETFLDRTGVDSLSSLNYSVYFRELRIGRLGFFNWVLSMVPLPSFWGIGWTPEYSYSVSFGDILGRGPRSSGWPAPVWGELFMQMGWAGALIAIPMGLGLAKLWEILDSENLKDFSPLAILLYVCAINGFISAFHSPIRACTRPFIYVLLMWAFLKILGLVGPIEAGVGKSKGKEHHFRSKLKSLNTS